MSVLKSLIDKPREFVGRVFRSGLKSEAQRAKVEAARKFRPNFAFGVIEGLLGVLSLSSGASRKSWFSYCMGVTLLFASAGYFLLDLREQKLLDLLADKLK